MRIQIVEDNPLIAGALKRNLKEYFTIDMAKNGKEAMKLLSEYQYDVILLDLNLPDIKGELICKEIRRRKISTPIIIVSGNDQITDKISLLNMGADDYITKPFNIEELRARINVALRHISNNAASGKLILGEVELNPAARIVKVRGKEVTLRRKEFDLLEYLMRNVGQTLTRNMILDHIWEMNETLWGNVVDVHIKHLRDRIDRPNGFHYIKTMHGLGYKFEIHEQ